MNTLAGEPAGLGDDQIAALRALVPELAAAAAAHPWMREMPMEDIDVNLSARC